MPSDSGVTSNSRTSVTSPASTPPYTHNTSVSMPSDSAVTSNSRTSITSPANKTTRPCSASYVSWQRDTARSCCWASAVQQSINISCLLDPHSAEVVDRWDRQMDTVHLHRACCIRCEQWQSEKLYVPPDIGVHHNGASDGMLCQKVRLDWQSCGKKCTTTQKLKPVSVASYDSRPENEADSFSKEKISNRKKDKEKVKKKG